jgi:hypothetical protein
VKRGVWLLFSLFQITVSGLIGVPAFEVFMISSSLFSVFANQVRPDPKLFVHFEINSCLNVSKDHRFCSMACKRFVVGALFSWAGRIEFR